MNGESKRNNKKMDNAFKNSQFPLKKILTKKNIKNERHKQLS